MGAGPLRRPKDDSMDDIQGGVAKSHISSSKISPTNPSTAHTSSSPVEGGKLSPRRQRYQRVKSISDLRFVFRSQSSKGDLSKQDDSRASSSWGRHSFSDLLASRKHHGTAATTPQMLSSSLHSELSMGSASPRKRMREPQKKMKSVQEIRDSRQQQVRQPNQDNSIEPEQSVSPPPLQKPPNDPETASVQSKLAVDTFQLNEQIMIEFENHVHQWIALFDFVPQADFEKAILGELLYLVANLPICANYSFWKGFCVTVGRRLKLPANTRVMMVLRRIHPNHTLSPLNKKKSQVAPQPRRNNPGRGPGGPGRGNMGGRGGRGGIGGRGWKGGGSGSGGRGGPGRGRGRGPKPRRQSDDHRGGRGNRRSHNHDTRNLSGNVSSHSNPPSLASVSNTVEDQSATSSTSRVAPWELSTDNAAGHLSWSSLDTRSISLLLPPDSDDASRSPLGRGNVDGDDNNRSQNRSSGDTSSTGTPLALSSDEQRALLRQSQRHLLQRRASAKWWNTQGIVHCREAFPPNDLLQLLLNNSCDIGGMHFTRRTNNVSASGRPTSSYAICGCDVGRLPSQPHAKIRIHYNRPLARDESSSTDTKPLHEFFIQTSSKVELLHHIRADGTQGSRIEFVPKRGEALPIASYDGNGEPLLSYEAESHVPSRIDNV